MVNTFVSSPIFSFRKTMPNANVLITANRALNDNFTLHKHDYFEIEIFNSGKAETVINGKKFKIEKGSAYILTPTDIHDFTVISTLNVVKIMLPTDFLSQESVFNLIDKAGVYQFTEQELENVAFISSLIVNEYEFEPQFYQENITNLLNSLLINFFRKSKEKINYCQISTSDSHITKALNYIFLNYTNNITSNDIANLLNISPIYFSSHFHKETGTTFINYLNGLRLERAKILLQDETLSVIDICYECGFNSSSNFLRAFKQKFGCSPNQYRQAHFKNRNS